MWRSFASPGFQDGSGREQLEPSDAIACCNLGSSIIGEQIHAWCVVFHPDSLSRSHGNWKRLFQLRFKAEPRCMHSAATAPTDDRELEPRIVLGVVERFLHSTPSAGLRKIQPIEDWLSCSQNHLSAFRLITYLRYCVCNSGIFRALPAESQNTIKLCGAAMDASWTEQARCT